MPQTAKDQITDQLRREGYDLITACQIYERAIAQHKDEPEFTLHTRDKSFTIRRTPLPRYKQTAFDF